MRGVVFNAYPHFDQDRLGILTVPGTAVRVAWFNDPDANVLRSRLWRRFVIHGSW
jgi:hypothetical protein